MDCAVTVKDVSKRFGSNNVLQGVSFEVAQGEIFGLLGPNGAGKSTLLNILCGIQNLDGGSVSFFGGSPNVDLRKSIALVPQDFAFYGSFTVQANFMFFGSSVGLKGKTLNERADFLMQWLGLEKFKNKEAEFLSGGYKRLLNIGLSLLWSPRLLFLDEVTVGLDPKMRSNVWARIRDLKAGGMSIILTTHYMEEAQGLCDRVCLLNGGKIAAIGTPTELVEKFGGDKTIVFGLDKEIEKSAEKEVEKLPNVKNAMVKGNTIIIGTDGKNVLGLSEKIADFFRENGFAVIKSNIKEPSLEQVFINLTGSDLKE